MKNHRKAKLHPCVYCGELFGGRGIPLNRKFCSRKCYQKSGFHSNFMKLHPNNGQKNVGIKKKKIKLNCIICNNEFEVAPFDKKRRYCSNKCFRKNIGNLLKGKPKSKKHIQKVVKSVKLYWDKIGRKKYRRSFHSQNKKYIEWRKRVFGRDNYTCQICEKRGERIFPHHIKLWALYQKSRYKISNGMTVCESCHKWCHQQRKNSSL